MAHYPIAELIDLEAFQRIIQSFYEVTGYPSTIVDVQNNVLITAGRQDIYALFHCTHPQTKERFILSEQLIFKYPIHDSFYGTQCLNGLCDYATPVIIDGEHLATVYVGQILHEAPDEYFFRQQAQTFGFDEETYIEALHKVPIIPKERMDAVLSFITQITQNLTIQGLERKRLFQAIAQRQQAEKDRQDNEVFYRQVVERIDAVIYVDAVDEFSSSIYMSPQVEVVLGYSIEEWWSEADFWFKIIHPDDLSRVQQEHWRTNQCGDPYDIEYRMIAKDGHVVWVRDRATLFKDEKGTPMGWWGSFEDITQRRQVEQVLRQEEFRNETLLHLSQMGHESVKTITDFFLESAIKLTNSEIGYLSFLNEEETVLSIFAWSKQAMQRCQIEEKQFDYQVDSAGLWGEAVRQRKPIITNDYAAPNPNKKGYPESHVSLTNLMNIPLFEGDHIVMVVGVGNKHSDYDEVDVRQLTLFMSGLWTIIQRKRAEDALKERVFTLTQPVGDLSTLRLVDIFDINEIQEIQDAFSQATGVASLITDVTGRPLTKPSNFCRLCKDIIRKTEIGLNNCMYSDSELGKVNPHGAIIQPCMSGGLWDGGTSIMVGDRHVANWLIGQVLDDSQNEEKMMVYAREIGADEEAYRAALKEIPRMPLAQFEQVAHALYIIAKYLSLLAVQNIQQAQFIAQRQKAEEALDQERTLLRTLINNIPDAVYVKDKNARKTLSNPIDLRNIGLTSEADVLGKTDFELFPPELAEKFYADDMLVIQKGQSVLNREEVVEDINGEQRYMLTSKIPLRDKEGNIVRLIGVGRDITERKQTEETIIRERNLLRALIDSAIDQVFVKDREGRFVLCNTAVAHSLNEQEIQNVIGKTDFDYFPLDLAERFKAEEQLILQNGQPLINREAKIVDGKGNTQWISTTKVGWRNEFGEIIGLVGINRYITEQIFTQEALFRERYLLQVVVNSTPDQVYIKDLNSRFILCNPATAYALGEKTPNDVVGKTDYDYHPMEQANKYLAEEQALINNGQPLLNVERPQLEADDIFRWFSITKVPWRNEYGDIVGLVGINRDITEIKKTEQDIRTLNTALEQRVAERTAQLTAANRELEDFAYSVSHDLRSPLRGIDGFSQALLEDFGDELQNQAKHYLQRIRNASQRMGQIIDDLLKLSQVTRANLVRMPINLSEITKSFLNEMQLSQPERKIQVIIKPGIVVDADPNLMRMALNNLLDNAWKFTVNRPLAKIELGETELRGQKVYFIRDNGVGFDMTYVDKIFGVFQRLHQLSEFEGTGIGLATVYRIIERHGGRIWAESVIDKGTSIYFTL